MKNKDRTYDPEQSVGDILLDAIEQLEKRMDNRFSRLDQRLTDLESCRGSKLTEECSCDVDANSCDVDAKKNLVLNVRFADTYAFRRVFPQVDFAPPNRDRIDDVFWYAWQTFAIDDWGFDDLYPCETHDKIDQFITDHVREIFPPLSDKSPDHDSHYVGYVIAVLASPSEDKSVWRLYQVDLTVPKSPADIVKLKPL